MCRIHSLSWAIIRTYGSVRIRRIHVHLLRLLLLLCKNIITQMYSFDRRSHAHIRSHPSDRTDTTTTDVHLFHSNPSGYKSINFNIEMCATPTSDLSKRATEPQHRSGLPCVPKVKTALGWTGNGGGGDWAQKLPPDCRLRMPMRMRECHGTINLNNNYLMWTCVPAPLLVRAVFFLCARVCCPASARLNKFVCELPLTHCVRTCGGGVGVFLDRPAETC